jgi:hypothetical protein
MNTNGERSFFTPSTSFPAAPRRHLFAPLDSLASLHVLLPAFRFRE